MRYEKSCGFVVYKNDGGRRLYLIIKQTNGDVGFPKGHVEEGESEIDAAIRELYEETGLCVDIIDGVRYSTEYPIPGRADNVKRAVYFLGEAKSDKIKIQEEELIEADFLSFEDAMCRLSFESTRQILRSAESMLKA